MRVLTDRRFLCAVVLLIANDRFAKAEWPGFITGKVSDFVGPIVAAVLAIVVLQALAPSLSARRAQIASIGLVSALMVAIKTSAVAAEAVESALAITGAAQSIVVDPTDLIGLVGLALVPRIVSDPAPISETRFVQSRAFKTGALGLAAFACVATSAIETPDYNAVSTSGDQIVVLETSDFSPGYLISEDRGQTWEYEIGDAPPTLPGPLMTETTLCLRNNQSLCVRSVPGLSVEESTDGGETWTNVYEIEPGAHLARFTTGDFADTRQEASVVSELDDGSVVVVMGQLPPAVRSVDGVWTPATSSYRSLQWGVLVLIVFASMVLAASAVLFAVDRKVFGVLVAVTSIPAIGLVWNFWFVNDTLGVIVFPFAMAFLVSVVAAPVLYLIGALMSAKKRSFQPVALLAFATPFVVGVVPLLPLVVWRAGITNSAATALLTMALAVGVAIGAGRLTSRIIGPAIPLPPRVPPAPSLIQPR